jgi:dTDP-4-dehydrorhamnose reductase
MPSILVFGSAGQLGWELLRTRWPDGRRAIGLPRAQCDVADAAAIARAIAEIRPALVVNAAAYTAVDRAEAEPDAAFRTNRDGPAALGAACAERDVPLVHLSTDYVFDGSKSGAYAETDPTAPLGIYGHSKRAGEDALIAAGGRHVILRTALGVRRGRARISSRP